MAINLEYLTSITKLSKSLAENEKRLELEKQLQVEKEPTLLNEIIYNIFYRVPISLLFSSIMLYSEPIYTHVCFFILSYIQENLLFILGHISLHLNDLYVNPSLKDMGVFSLISYVHHYYNSFIFSQYNFISYCNGYIIVNFKYTYNVNELLYLVLLPILTYVISNNGMFVMLSAATSYIGLTRLSQLSIVGHIMYWCGVNNKHIVIYTCYQILQSYLQAIVHLWYHTPGAHKPQHFGPLLYTILTNLEDVNVISSEEHKLHHKHNRYNTEEVEMWNVLYVPPVVNDIGTTIFKYIMTLNKSTEEKLKTYKIIHAAGNLIIIFGITYVCVFLCRVIM
jgi:hypothetical protein